MNLKGFEHSVLREGPKNDPPPPERPLTRPPWGHEEDEEQIIDRGGVNSGGKLSAIGTDGETRRSWEGRSTKVPIAPLSRCSSALP